MTDIIENEEIDKDTVEAEELNNLFSKKYTLLTETAVALQKTYINKLSITTSLNIAVNLLDNSIQVYKLSNTSLSQVCRLSGHKKQLTELVFSPIDDYLLYSAGHDGIKLWDIRTSGLCVLEYKDEDDGLIRPYECMDISCTGRVLCAGSQLVREDAYMVFWDRRSPEPLGGYWNSHTDDITQVKFHKTKPDILASGALDGLLNVYDAAEATEDDALTYTLNVDNSVERLAWLPDATRPDALWCLTRAEEAQLWDAAAGRRLHRFGRESIAGSIKRSRGDDCYAVDAYGADGRAALLAGSRGGGGHALRAAAVRRGRLRPTALFADNAQVVRCCAHHAPSDALVTGGEAGLVDVWGVAEPEAE